MRNGVSRATASRALGRPAFDVAHVPNTNRFRAPDADDPDAFVARLLAETDVVIRAEGAETIGMLIAEPVQNAGGCFTAPEPSSGMARSG